MRWCVNWRMLYYDRVMANQPKDFKFVPSDEAEALRVPYQPKTGQKCHCRPGIQRDNCPDCEGTGMRIDFAKIRAATVRND